MTDVQRETLAERLERLRAELGDKPIQLRGQFIDGFDLMEEALLLGAVVWKKSDFDTTPVGGVVIHYDDEGVRTVRFGMRYGKFSVLSEDVIPFSQIDPATTVPGGTAARHAAARQIWKVLSARKGTVSEYERRLDGFANRLAALEPPFRQKNH